MTFESTFSIIPGVGVSARLDPSANRLTIEPLGNPTAEAIALAAPRVLQLLADKSGLPVRHDGRVYRPGVVTLTYDSRASANTRQTGKLYSL